MTIMKVITVWQPWASLIAIGAKPYEFRGWVPPEGLIGQRIGIHAGARKPRIAEVTGLLDQLHYPEEYGSTCLHKHLAAPLLEALADALTIDKHNPLPLAHVLCTGILGKPKRGDECAAEFGQDVGNDSDREGTFNWGWPITDIEHFEPPIPAKGLQGFWNWSGQ